MTRQYTFNFDNFTVGHVMALHSGDFAAQVAAIHELTEGGIYHLPQSELTDVVAQFVAAHNAFVKSEMESFKMDMTGDSDLWDMLKEINGL